LIYILGLHPPLNGASKSVVGAQMTTFLTGLLAVHKSMSSWLDKRKVIGNFWRAESELKTILYAFEDKWKNKAYENDTLSEEFISAAKESIIRARAVVSEEQGKFFDACTYPSIDLSAILGKAGNDARALVNSHSSPEFIQYEKAQKAKEEARIKIEQHEDEVMRLNAKIAAINKLIVKKNQMKENDSVNGKALLGKDIAELQTIRRKAEGQLIIAESELAALKARIIE